MTPTARILGAPALHGQSCARIAPAPARRPRALAGRMHRRGTALSAALSATLHLTALAAFATLGPGGEPSGGSGGAMLVTLVGSDAALAALTDAWTQPDAVAAPDPEARPDRTLAPPDPAPPRQPGRLAVAAAPEPATADLETPRPPEQPAATLTPYGTIPATPSVEPGSPATAADPPPRPRPADLPPSATQAEARQTTSAAGSGGGREAGPRAAAAVATGAAAARASAIDVWKRQIQRVLQRSLPVPRGFEQATRDLRVTLALRVAPDGRLRAAEVRRSSGEPTLDAAALRAVHRMGRLPRAPAGLTDPAYEFDAPLELEAP